jgi:hypothetical protein
MNSASPATSPRESRPCLSSLIQCGLTGRSTGPPTACRPGRVAVWYIICLAARAPHRRRPVNSALGSGMQEDSDRGRQVHQGNRRGAPNCQCKRAGKVLRREARTDSHRPCRAQSSHDWGPRSNQHNMGASRRPAAPGSQSGCCRRGLVRLVGFHHRARKAPVTGPATLTTRAYAVAKRAGSGCNTLMVPPPARSRCLTSRSTGAPTACRLGRDALVVHHPPRGPGVTPLSPG